MWSANSGSPSPPSRQFRPPSPARVVRRPPPGPSPPRLPSCFWSPHQSPPPSPRQGLSRLYFKENKDDERPRRVVRKAVFGVTRSSTKSPPERSANSRSPFPPGSPAVVARVRVARRPRQESSRQVPTRVDRQVPATVVCRPRLVCQAVFGVPTRVLQQVPARVLPESSVVATPTESCASAKLFLGPVFGSHQIPPESPRRSHSRQVPARVVRRPVARLPRQESSASPWQSRPPNPASRPPAELSAVSCPVPAKIIPARVVRRLPSPPESSAKLFESSTCSCQVPAGVVRQSRLPSPPESSSKLFWSPH